jgi:hypothetical protein
MSKRPFKEIEQIIKDTPEAHEPAFNEASWKKMEAMLDKEDDRKRPFVFWLWWLLPLLIGAGLLSYFAFNKNNSQREITAVKKNDVPAEKTGGKMDAANKHATGPVEPNPVTVNSIPENGNDAGKIKTAVSGKTSKPPVIKDGNVLQSKDEDLFTKKNRSGKDKAKMKGKITAAEQAIDNEQDVDQIVSNVSPEVKTKPVESISQEEVVVIKVDADKAGEKEIEKIIDSIVKKPGTDNKQKNRFYRFYIIAAAGAEASGVKLFAADKITGRYGLALGYQVNKNLSVQAGFFSANKKYKATGSDYKTKPGTYWNIVDIKNIEANCKVYEIPVTVRYDFMPGKILNIFAAAGLSSYVMKKEDYRFSYEHNGTMRQAKTTYNGNKNLFSVLRITGGAEKKISGKFSVFASPGIAIPLSGVGEGEVKLYSMDMIFGIKFTPATKK